MRTFDNPWDSGALPRPITAPLAGLWRARGDKGRSLGTMRYVALVCTLGFVLAAGCSRSSGAGDNSARHSWSQAGFLRIAVVSEPKSLNPLLGSNTTEIFIDKLMFEPLVSADQRGTPVPMLATDVPSLSNGGIGKDGLTITYHLRKDAKWTDGEPVTSKDVKFSWQAIVNPNNNAISRHGYDIVRSIDTPDDSTVVVHLKERFAPFVNTFFAESDQPYEVVPAHVLAKYPNINQLPFNQEPTVSDGPFKFASWTHGDDIEFVANPGFWEGKPGLDRIKVSFVPNENTSINQLRAHEIDYMFQASIATYPTLKDLPDIKIVWVDMNGFEAVQFNVARVTDPLVRRAIAYAFDKPALVARLTHGQAKVATEDLPDWMWAFDPSIKSYPYDLNLARNTLAQAGYTPGPDGIVRKNGAPLTLLLSTDTENATHREESLLVQEALKRIGVDVEIKYYPQNILYETSALGGIIQGGKFDLTLAPWYAGIDPDNSSQFLCSMFPPGGYNTSRYCSPAMDAAQHIALTRYDQATRKVAYSHVEHTLSADNPYVYFWWQRQQEAISVDFKGFAPNPVVESWNAWQWSI